MFHFLCIPYISLMYASQTSTPSELHSLASGQCYAGRCRFELLPCMRDIVSHNNLFAASVTLLTNTGNGNLLRQTLHKGLTLCIGVAWTVSAISATNAKSG